MAVVEADGERLVQEPLDAGYEREFLRKQNRRHLLHISACQTLYFFFLSFVLSRTKKNAAGRTQKTAYNLEKTENPVERTRARHASIMPTVSVENMCRRNARHTGPLTFYWKTDIMRHVRGL